MNERRMPLVIRAVTAGAALSLLAASPHADAAPEKSTAKSITAAKPLFHGTVRTSPPGSPGRKPAPGKAPQAVAAFDVSGSMADPASSVLMQDMAEPVRSVKRKGWAPKAGRIVSAQSMLKSVQEIFGEKSLQAANQHRMLSIINVEAHQDVTAEKHAEAAYQIYLSHNDLQHALYVAQERSWIENAPDHAKWVERAKQLQFKTSRVKPSTEPQTPED